MNKKNLRIAIYYDNRYGRNDGPPRYYLNAMEGKMKMDVTHLIPYEKDVDKHGPYDLHFWVDWGEDAVLGREQALTDGIPNDGGKKIYVVSDAHIDDGYRFEKAKQFDCVFFNQKHYIKEYIEYAVLDKEKKLKLIQELTHVGYNLVDINNKVVQQVFYLPHAAEPDIFYNFNQGDKATIKKYDICFIGHMQEYHKDNTINMSRIDVLDKIFREIPNFYFGTRNPGYPDKNIFQDAAKRFCESKVVFNISIGNDVNMRFFEILSTGSFQLVNWIPELENIEKEYDFHEGTDYVSYKTMDEAIRKAKYYIEHDDERERIALSGFRQLLKTGTYEARVREIFDKLNLPIKSK